MQIYIGIPIFELNNMESFLICSFPAKSSLSFIVTYNQYKNAMLHPNVKFQSVYLAIQKSH